MNKELLVKRIEGLIEFNQGKISEMNEKLTRNFVHNFSWYGEDLFMHHFKNDMYKALLIDINEYGAKEVLTAEIEGLKSYTSSPYLVRENSTGSLHREVSTWKFICKLQLLKEYEEWAKVIA
jgi:hypothetical protein